VGPTLVISSAICIVVNVLEGLLRVQQVCRDDAVIASISGPSALSDGRQ